MCRVLWFALLPGEILDAPQQQGSIPMVIDANMSDSGNEIHRDESASLISADRVKGTSVYDSEGEKIGSIDSVMLAKKSGKVAYAIMSFGGFLGMGEKYHPLPWHMLDYDTELMGYRVPTAAAALKDAPAYDRALLEVPETGAAAWQGDTDTYYGRQSGGRAGGMSQGLGNGADRL